MILIQIPKPSSKMWLNYLKINSDKKPNGVFS